MQQQNLNLDYLATKVKEYIADSVSLIEKLDYHVEHDDLPLVLVDHVIKMRMLTEMSIEKHKKLLETIQEQEKSSGD
jgi:hypothetical protein